MKPKLAIINDSNPVWNIIMIDGVRVLISERTNGKWQIVNVKFPKFAFEADSFEEAKAQASDFIQSYYRHFNELGGAYYGA